MYDILAEDWIGRTKKAGPPSNLFGQMQAISTHSVDDARLRQMRASKIPILMMCAGEDHLVRAHHSHRMAAILKPAEFIEFKGLFHVLLFFFFRLLIRLQDLGTWCTSNVWQNSTLLWFETSRGRHQHHCSIDKITVKKKKDVAKVHIFLTTTRFWHFLGSPSLASPPRPSPSLSAPRWTTVRYGGQTRCKR